MALTNLSYQVKFAKENCDTISQSLDMLEKGVIEDIDFDVVEKKIVLLREHFKVIKDSYENNISKLKRVKKILSENSKKYSFVITSQDDGIHMMINSKQGLFGKEKHNMYLLVNNSGELLDMIYDADAELLKLVSDASKAVFGVEPQTFNTSSSHH